MATWSQRQRVLAQIQHRETDYLPYTLRYEDNIAENLDAHYGSSRWRTLLDDGILRVPGPRLVMIEEAADPYYTDHYGSTWRTDRRPFYLVKPALKTASLQGYEFPQIAKLVTAEILAEANRFIEQHPDHFLVIGFGFGLWERTFALRGFENALMDAVAEPSFFEELIAAVAAHQLEIVDRLLQLPVDGILFSDDWGYQQGVLLGAERWRRVLKPHLAEAYARVHRAGKLTLSHCCGSVAEILPDIIEIGLDVLESVQPEAKGMDPYELKRRFGSNITFWGCLGSQSAVPFGTPEDIRAEVSKLCREMGRGGGYVLSTAKPLQPETPTENAAAVVESFLQQAGVRFP